MRIVPPVLAMVLAVGTFAMTGCLRDYGHDDRARIYSYDEHRSYHRPYEPYHRVDREEHRDPGVELRIHD